MTTSKKQKKVSHIKKVFGTGPLCFIMGLFFVSVVYQIELAANIPKIPLTDPLATIFFTLFMVLTFFTVFWGFTSLPVDKRGEELVTRGAFKYVRHPIYAGFIDFFVIGIGFYLMSYGIILSVIPLLFICGRIVSREEQYLESVFGKRYTKYMEQTARFIPGVY